MVLLAGHTDCVAFRCGSGFVTVGDSQTKVALQCGQPTSKQKAGVKKEVGDAAIKQKQQYKKASKKERERKHGTQKQSVLRSEYEGTSGKKVEKWYYNCGENDFIYVLTFEGGVLKSEETEGYGRGKSDCKGR
jgi:hypothetical protein